MGVAGHPLLKAIIDQCYKNYVSTNKTFNTEGDFVFFYTGPKTFSDAIFSFF